MVLNGDPVRITNIWFYHGNQNLGAKLAFSVRTDNLEKIGFPVKIDNKAHHLDATGSNQTSNYFSLKHLKEE